MNTYEKLGFMAFVAFGIGLIASFAGYITNIFWLFKNIDDITAEFILAAVGVLAFPLGALHGIYSWF